MYSFVILIFFCDIYLKIVLRVRRARVLSSTVKEIFRVVTTSCILSEYRGPLYSESMQEVAVRGQMKHTPDCGCLVTNEIIIIVNSTKFSKLITRYLSSKNIDKNLWPAPRRSNVMRSVCLSFCLSVCLPVSRITAKVVSQFHWNLVLWLGLPSQGLINYIGDDAHSGTVFHFLHHYGIEDFRRCRWYFAVGGFCPRHIVSSGFRLGFYVRPCYLFARLCLETFCQSFRLLLLSL